MDKAVNYTLLILIRIVAFVVIVPCLVLLLITALIIVCGFLIGGVFFAIDCWYNEGEEEPSPVEKYVTELRNKHDVDIEVNFNKDK